MKRERRLSVYIDMSPIIWDDGYTPRINESMMHYVTSHPIDDVDMSTPILSDNVDAMKFVYQATII